VTSDEGEVLTPGPDGRLISTDERMQHVREAQQSESPPPTSGMFQRQRSIAVDTSSVQLNVSGNESVPGIIITDHSANLLFLYCSQHFGDFKP